VKQIVFGSMLVLCACQLSFNGGLQAADPPADSVAAKLTREKKLKAKVTLDCENLMLRELISEIQGALKDAKAGTLRISWDPKAVTSTTRLTIKCKDMPLEDALDKMFKDSGRPWGYYVVVATKKDDQNDGALFIVADETCRGYPPGDPRNKKTEAKKEEPKKSK